MGNRRQRDGCTNQTADRCRRPLDQIAPMILLLYTPTRQNRFWRMVALFLVAAGVVAYRCDINIEILTGSAIIAYGLTAFSLGVKYSRVVDHSLVEASHEKVMKQSREAVPA